MDFYSMVELFLKVDFYSIIELCLKVDFHSTVELFESGFPFELFCFFSGSGPVDC